jgi:hypothetical protein
MSRSTNWQPNTSLSESEWFDKVPKSVLFEIALPPRAVHRFMGPRHDHVILQDGDVWIGQQSKLKAE